MADIKVRDLTDTSSIALDNQIMVLTNDEQNQVQNITVENLLSNVLSSDNGNVLEQGTDGKLYVETPGNITGELADLDTVNKTSLVNSINEVVSNLSNEATTRANADNNLQSQIDAITAASDVTDIVGTYAQLQTYDTTGLPDNSIIKVLQDESRQDETTYYRWVITGGVGAWVLIGEEGPYYTKSQADSLFATQQTTGNLASLDTSDKTSLVNAINELSSVLDPTQTADYINNSKAVESGAISSNSIILSDVIKYAHSSFDLSKFTVVGSPVITDDGIASGFTTSNYVSLPSSYTLGTDFECYFPFILSNLTTETQIYRIQSGNTFRALVTFTPAYGVLVNMSDGTNAMATGGNKFAITTDELTANELYIAVIKLKNQTCHYGCIHNGVYTEAGTIENFALDMPEFNTVFIGKGNTLAFTGSIDLKYFKFIANGVELISGNKTGIDTIKPDDYTVVGTPTISADGIASGFSGSNYITASAITETTFTIKETIITGSDGSGAQIFLYVYRATDTSDRLFDLRLSNNNFALVYKNSGGTITVINSVSVTVIPNTKYDIKIVVNSGKLYYYINGTLVYTANDLYSDGIGKIQTNTGEFNGSIDLNAFKIYVDGNLVYQPCLKIPYTLSKTGSKIVNAVYRGRVNDMASQFGYANYYTLSDTDFTLPQVELYGYIEKRARDIVHPVAEPFYRFDDTINDDEVRLEGAEVDKGLYLAIEQKLALYCTAGSTSDKICLPDFRDRVPWGANTQGYISAGLPDIVIETYGESGAENGHIANGGNVLETPIWRASTYNSIYGNSTTVQPPAFKVRWLARYK